MSENWWPDGYDLPAFRIKRATYGINTGGDWVRGSAGGRGTPEVDEDGNLIGPIITLAHTALRYPTKALDPSAFAAAAKGILFAKAFDYNTVEIEWAWPTSIKDTFQEVAVVRSTFGCPADPSQGQTIFRAPREALLYTTDNPETPEDETTMLAPPPLIYDVLEPSFRWENGKKVPLVQPNGHWYYYTAFFRTNPYDWTPMMYNQCLLPRNYRHSDHLWDSLPPWYQFTDDNYSVGAGFLRRFLTIFGFEQDRVREYVEGVLNLHWVDRSPMPLLKGLGANYGYPYEQGLGEIRYRGLLANLSHLLLRRGTTSGLLGLVETISKYDCDLTPGPNNVLLPDDSTFLTGTGHWAPAHPTLDLADPPKTDYLTFDKVKLAAQSTDTIPVGNTVSSYMLVDTALADTGDIFLTIGAGKIDVPDPDPDQEFVPLLTGIPVDPGEAYGYSLWIKMASPSPVKLGMIPFLTAGQVDTPAGVLTLWGDTHGPALSGDLHIAADTWTELAMTAVVPDDCHYFVPAIYIDARVVGTGTRSAPIYIGAVMVNAVPNEVPLALTGPDQYFALGSKVLGPEAILGEPLVGDLQNRPSSFFTKVFKDALFADTGHTLLNPGTIRLVLFSHAPQTDLGVGPWADTVETVADLVAYPGWTEVSGISGYPITTTITVNTTAVAIPATTPTRYNRYVMFGVANEEKYPFSDLNEPVHIQAVGIEYVGTLPGSSVVNPLLMASTTPIGDGTDIYPDDWLTATPDIAFPTPPSRWMMAWGDPPSGATGTNVIEGPLSIWHSPPAFEASNTVHVWLYPSRANMICNPSFSAVGTEFWASSGTLARVADSALGSSDAFAGQATGTAPLVVESNLWSTRYGNLGEDLWTIQLMAKGDGPLKLGLISWDAQYRSTACDWGEDETWDLTPDAWIHIAVLRRAPDADQAMLRFEVNGTTVTFDKVLAERGALKEWPYFDGDSTFALQDSYTWYGGLPRRGGSYSMWYDMRRSVMGRLFATPVDTTYPGDVLSDAEVALAGMVYQWVPAGAVVIPHIDVFYPGDIRQPPAPKEVTVQPYWDESTPLGVTNPWV